MDFAPLSSIGGLSPLDLCAEFGTPLYVYDASVIERQYKRLSKALSGVPHRLQFAAKALSNLSILKYLGTLGAGVDAVSIEEVRLALMAGFPPERILFTPNSVSFDEIAQAVELGIHINIDAISILEQFGAKYGNSVPVCVRINPHIMAGGHANISTGHIDSKFGISIHQLRHVERIVKSLNIDVRGLHMHTGSDILDIDVFLRGADILFDLAEHFPGVTFLDFGSGFKVAYKPDDYTSDVEELGRRLAERYAEYTKQTGRQLELWFEPGKFLVSESGYFFATVNVIKQTTATVFAGINTGFNHLIRPMFYNAYHYIENVSNPSGIQRVYTVVGYICETDTFAWDRKIAEIREGDVLVFRNAGAYGFSMSSNFNSRLRPCEVLVHNGKAHVIRERETFEDLIRKQNIIDF